MKNYAKRLFIQGALYFVMELLFVAMIVGEEMYESPVPRPLYLYPAILGAGIAAYAAYRTFNLALIARKLAQQS